MNYRNEIVGNGRLNNFGNPITSNAGESVHRGVELEFEYDILSHIHRTTPEQNRALTLNGNLTWSENYYKTYIAQEGIDELGNIIYGADYSGNKILLNPQIITNLSLNFTYGRGFNAYVTMQYVGKQYLDNTENEKKNPEAKQIWSYIDKIIKPYIVFNAGVTLDVVSFFTSYKLSRFLKSLEASLRISNIFNSLYEPSGGIDFNGAPVWIPSAERNIFFNLKAVF
ncbi:MAG: TonB-dependent receptor domain-containing protein [Ignavibacteria bacterium]